MRGEERRERFLPDQTAVKEVDRLLIDCSSSQVSEEAAVPSCRHPQASCPQDPSHLQVPSYHLASHPFPFQPHPSFQLVCSFLAAVPALGRENSFPFHPFPFQPVVVVVVAAAAAAAAGAIQFGNGTGGVQWRKRTN